MFRAVLRDDCLSIARAIVAEDELLREQCEVAVVAAEKAAEKDTPTPAARLVAVALAVATVRAAARVGGAPLAVSNRAGLTPLELAHERGRPHAAACVQLRPRECLTSGSFRPTEAHPADAPQVPHVACTAFA